MCINTQLGSTFKDLRSFVINIKHLIFTSFQQQHQHQDPIAAIIAPRFDRWELSSLRRRWRGHRTWARRGRRRCGRLSGEPFLFANQETRQRLWTLEVGGFGWWGWFWRPWSESRAQSITTKKKTQHHQGIPRTVYFFVDFDWVCGDQRKKIGQISPEPIQFGVTLDWPILQL